jgi:hypothetical protein
MESLKNYNAKQARVTIRAFFIACMLTAYAPQLAATARYVSP